MTLYQNEAVSIRIGERLRELRLASNLSIRALAIKSGLSIHTITQIEKEKTSPSVSALYKLTDALGVSVAAFFFNGETSHKQTIFLKADERSRMSFTRGMIEGLGGETFVGRIEPFLLTLESGANSGPQSISHTGYEFVFCLRGELEYQVENQIYMLAPGDSLLFEAHLNHRWRNPGRTVVNALVTISGSVEGDDLHGMHWRAGE